MSSYFLPTSDEIRDAFEDEISKHGGQVTDVYDRRKMLFLRSVFPTRQLVRPGDALKGGVALRTRQNQVDVHSYVFREICKNGAIGAVVLESTRIARHDFAASNEQIDDVLQDIRQAVCHCSDESVLNTAVVDMHQSMRHPADLSMLLNLIALTNSSEAIISRYVDQIVEQFNAGGDNSVYGLMNAVTATARETRDPEDRWRLEELGGGIPALLSPVRKPSGAAAVLV
jgi:hypothetical protein